MIRGKDLHGHILRQIELALGRRSWNWLARESSVAQSTLATQAGKPKFSVDVLLRIAEALDKDVGYFLPEVARGEPWSTAAQDALARIADIADRGLAAE